MKRVEIAKGVYSLDIGDVTFTDTAINGIEVGKKAVEFFLERAEAIALALDTAIDKLADKLAREKGYTMTGEIIRKIEAFAGRKFDTFAQDADCVWVSCFEDSRSEYCNYHGSVYFACKHCGNVWGRHDYGFAEVIDGNRCQCEGER